MQGKYFRELGISLLLPLALAGRETAGGALKQAREPSGSLETQQQWPGFRGDLRGLLEHVAESYRLPMLIVLAGEPPQVGIPEGKLSAREILDAAVRAAPDHTWEAHGSAVYFYNRPLAKNPNYFLDWKIGWFRIPSTVADLDLFLRSELGKIREHIVGSGGLVVGLRSNELSRHTLTPTVVHNLTTAEIMSRALSMDRGFYCVIQFPNFQPNRTDDLDRAFANWRWVPLRSPTPKSAADRG